MGMGKSGPWGWPGSGREHAEADAPEHAAALEAKGSRTAVPRAGLAGEVCRCTAAVGPATSKRTALNNDTSYVCKDQGAGLAGLAGLGWACSGTSGQLLGQLGLTGVGWPPLGD